MPRHVRCKVEECVFNEDHGCTADEIEVLSNGNDIVGTPQGTLCATYRYMDFDDGTSYRPASHARGQ